MGSRVLVLGGTGSIGAAAVRALTRAGCVVDFTFLQSTERADTLREQTGARAVRCDVTDGAQLREVIAKARPLRALLHAVAIAADDEKDPAQLERMWRTNVQSALVAARAFAEGEPAEGPRNLVICATLDATESVRSPAGFACTQGALLSMVRALAHELGPSICVNLAVLGVTDGGISRDLSAARREEYARFAALGRVGRAEDVVGGLCYLLLENTALSGSAFPLTGGL